MSNRKSKRRYLFSHLLILCCFTFCLSACISGEITCEKCGPGEIAILVFDRTTAQLITLETFDNCGPYFIQVSPSYIGKQVSLIAVRDKDNNEKNSVGDCFGYYPELQEGWRAPSFELQLMNNNCNIAINREITATIEGEVNCDEYTSGLMSVWALDGPPGSDPSPNKISEAGVVTMEWNEEKNTYSGTYLIYVFDTPEGSQVWVMGQWNIPDDGYYIGEYQGSFKLDQTITGIDFDACQEEVE